MSDQIPLKVIRTAGDTTALGEFEIGEEVGILHGGTGADTAPDARTNLAVPPNTLVLTAGAGLSGGGDLTADRAFAVNVQKSIEIDTDILQLTNDLASPGNDQVYGTDGAGVKGWKADPASGGGFGGEEHQEAESLGESSTSSSTWIEKLTITTGSLPSGKYRIGWSFEWRNSYEEGGLLARVMVDDSTQLLDHRGHPGRDGESGWFNAGGFAYLSSFSGVHDIDFDFSQTGDGTGYVRNVRLEIWRVS